MYAYTSSTSYILVYHSMTCSYVATQLCSYVVKSYYKKSYYKHIVCEAIKLISYAAIHVLNAQLHNIVVN